MGREVRPLALSIFDMRIYFLFALLLFSVFVNAQKKNGLDVYDLRSENHTDPIGIDAEQPRFSWKLSSTQEDVMQTGYEIRISKDIKFKTFIPVTSASSGQSILVPYQGKGLEPLTRYYWRVRVKDNKGNQSAWSKTAFFETGFLTGAWQAKWIDPEKEISEKESGPPTLLRKEFKVDKRIRSARYYITSRGLYLAYLNGKLITDKVFTPGWTVYNKRLQYQVFDVTSLLAPGMNATGIELAEGWYRGELGWVNNRALYGKRLGVLAELHITYTDGTKEIVASDDSWKATDLGPIRFSGIYNGETYDARMELQGWSSSGFNDGNWWNAKLSENQQQALTWQQGAFVGRIQEITPVKIFRTPKGELVADMGQNMVGRVRLTVKGDAGSTVSITHAEVLDKQGNFYTENLRAAKQLLQYTLKGGNTGEVYEPHFTFMGFRYIRIEGFPGELKPEHVKGIVIHSEMKPTSAFETSHPLINQLQHNIVWGQKGNFLDVPTDCPQRDERLGWTGDAQAFVRTAAFNMDIQAFFTKWLKDVEADQYANGAIPFVVPDVLRNNATSAGWADAAVIAPWTIYLCYGDSKLLEDQYGSMKKYVEYIRKQSGDSMIWKRGSVFGDWLYYKPEFFNHTTADGHTDLDLISTAFYGYSTSLLAKSAAALGKKDDEIEYRNLFNKIQEAFNREYVSPSGRVYSGSQTGYVLALMFDLLPENKRLNAAKYLAEDIRARGNHLSTGFLGTSYLPHVLSMYGQEAVAYDLLFQETFPSWLYPVKMGATTIWERWDGIRQDSSFQDKGMNSFNHYAYGAVGEWMYRRVAGIETDEQKPGYRNFRLQPSPGGKFSFVKASFESAHGQIRSEWEIKDGMMNYFVKIPANTTADIRLPKAAGKAITMNGKPLAGSRQDGEHVTLAKGSGEYKFTWAW